MKYLFFDIECASVHHGSKMCSFGYVLTDENLNVIESDDIIINPKSEWDWYTLENILAYPAEYYEAFPSFDERYERIRALFEGEVIAFGHGVTNDVRFLNDDCKRYSLPFIDYSFYDCADIYKEFENNKEVKSLAKVSKEIGEHEQNERHESKQDAMLVYEYTKEMCEQMNVSLKELLALVPNCKGQNKNGNCSYRNINKKRKPQNKDAGRLYECFLENVEPNKECADKFLTGKRIAISENYERKNFKPMLLIVQLITNLGGEYVTSGKEADVYVTADGKKPNEDYCQRELDFDERIDNGEDLEKLTIHEFLGIIDYDEDMVQENYQDVCKKIVKIIRKEERESKKR